MWMKQKMFTKKSIAIQKRIHDKRNGNISYEKCHSYWPADGWKKKKSIEIGYKRKTTAIKEFDYNRILYLFAVGFFLPFQWFFRFSHNNRRIRVRSIILFHLTVFWSFQCFIVMFFFSFYFCFLIFGATESIEQQPREMMNSNWIDIDAHQIYQTPLIRVNIQHWTHVRLPFNRR